MEKVKPEKQREPVHVLGFWSSLIVTVLGAVYFLIIVYMLIAGDFRLPPPDYAQKSAAVIDLLMCPLMVILFASLLAVTPKEKKLYALIGLVFCVAFAVMVTINRFTQLTVVEHGMAGGNVEGLYRFLPYEPDSVMFALELFGFGYFLSLALLFGAFSLPSGSLQKKIKVFFCIYFALGFASIFGYIFDSLLTNVGFLAWGLILYVGTGLMAVYFKRIAKITALEEK